MTVGSRAPFFLVNVLVLLGFPSQGPTPQNFPFCLLPIGYFFPFKALSGRQALIARVGTFLTYGRGLVFISFSPFSPQANPALCPRNSGASLFLVPTNFFAITLVLVSFEFFLRFLLVYCFRTRLPRGIRTLPLVQ